MPEDWCLNIRRCEDLKSHSVGKIKKQNKALFGWNLYLTIINVNLTESACKTWRTHTLEGSNIIDARCPILTGN
jgi:hypothetical protein